jgi:hypothetical protein
MKRIWSGVLAIAVTGTASAQGPIMSAKLAELQPAKFGVPLCPLKPEGKVQKGVEALRKAHDPKADKAALLKQGLDLITAGISEGGGTSAAASTRRLPGRRSSSPSANWTSASIVRTIGPTSPRPPLSSSRRARLSRPW